MLEMVVMKAATDRVIPLTRLASVLKHAQSVQELTITWRRIRALQSALAEEVANQLVELGGAAEENSSPTGAQSKEIVDLVEGLLEMAVEEQQQRSNTMHTKRLVERALVVNRTPVVLCPASQRLDSATRYFLDKSFNLRGMVGSIRPQYVPGGFDYGGRYGRIAEVNSPQPYLLVAVTLYHISKECIYHISNARSLSSLSFSHTLSPTLSLPLSSPLS
jgi:hypothetical protein